MFWYKYKHIYEQRYTRSYAHEYPRCIQFKDWISLYSKEIMDWKVSDNPEFKETWELCNNKLLQKLV